MYIFYFNNCINYNVLLFCLVIHTLNFEDEDFITYLSYLSELSINISYFPSKHNRSLSNLLNFLNRKFQLPFLKLFIIIFWTLSSVQPNSIKPGVCAGSKILVEKVNSFPFTSRVRVTYVPYVYKKLTPL